MRMPIHNVTMMSGVIAVLFITVFLLDVLTPLGLPVSIFYVVPLMLTSLLRRRDAPYWLAAAGSVASLGGYFLSPSLSGIPSWLPITNHTAVLVLLWLVASIIRRQQDMADHLIQVASLEAENRAHILKEQALQRQAEEIHDLYNRAPCGYHSLDATGRYVEVNDTELQWLGYRREDIVGQMLFRNLLIPPSASRFDEIFPRFVVQGSIRDLELDLMRKDRSLLPVSLSATAIRDSEGRYIASRSTTVDITERRRTEAVLRQAHEALETQVQDRTAELAMANRRLEEQLEESRRTEQALRVSENRFRLTADHAPVLIWISDSTKARTWSNKPWLEFVGRRMEQEVGNGWVDNVHPEDAARCLGIYTASFDAQRKFTMEYRLRRQDGTWRWILDHGIPRYEGDGSFAGYIGSCTDIDDRKCAEELQGRLAAIVDSSSDAIISVFLDGTVSTWNEGAQRMFGYGADEMVGYPIYTIIPSERHAEETGILERAARGERIEHYETIRTTKDRTSLDVSLSVSPIRDVQGHVIGIAKILRDVTVWKRTEAALRRKSQLIELSHEPIFAWDVEGGIIEWNRGCEQLYGFTRAEAVNRRSLDLLSTVFLESLDDIMTKLRLSGQWTGELLHQTKDHRKVIVESRWGCIDQDGRRIVLETNQDITERKRVEETLRESEVRFRKMADAAPAMLWVTEPDGSGSFLSRGWYEFTGQTEEEGLGQDGFGWLDAVHPEDREQAGRIFLEANAKRRLFSLDYRLRRADGDYRWALDTGRPRFGSNGEFLGYVGSVLDITERKRTEEALRRAGQESQRAYEYAEAILRTSPVPLLVLEKDFLVTTANEAFYSTFQVDAAETQGRLVYELGNGQWNIPKLRELLEDILPHQTMITGFEVIHDFRSIGHRTMLLNARRMENEPGTTPRIVLVIEDITERKNAETVLINKNKDLETLLYVTSHDLKEPLRAIESFSQLLLERYADRIDAQGGDYLRRIGRATQRLNRLLNDILDLLQAQRMLPPMEEVAAEALVKEALTRLDNRIRETGAAVRIISPLPRLRVNRMWATQGLYNLLANAMKFTRDGHAPDIEIASYEVPASATPSAGVVVKDRGPGVPTRQAERIFMLFQRAVGRDVEGTGAGLAIVQQVAERHGGRAWVQPRAGGGSEFVMTFACSTHNHNGGASPI